MTDISKHTIESQLFASEIWNMISLDKENEEHENVVDNVDVADTSSQSTNEPIKRSFGLTHIVLNTLLPIILLSSDTPII